VAGTDEVLVRAGAEKVPVWALPDSRPRLEGSRLEIPDKLLTPNYALLHPTRHVHTPHTPIPIPILSLGWCIGLT